MANEYVIRLRVDDEGVAQTFQRVASEAEKASEAITRSTGALTGQDVGRAIESMLYTATVQGVVQGLLITGPIATAMDGFSEEMSAALQDALKDGVIDRDEAEKLKGIGDEWRRSLAPLLKGVGSVFDGLFDDREAQRAFRELRKESREAAEIYGGELGVGIRRALRSVSSEDLAAAAEQAGTLFSGAISDAVFDALAKDGPVNFEELGKQVNLILFDYVSKALIDAFIASAAVQGAIAPMLAVIGTIFDQIINKEITIADGIVKIGEQIGLISDVFASEEFQGAITALLSGLTSLRDELGILPSDLARNVTDPARDAVDAAKDVVGTGKDVCRGVCDLKKETAEYASAEIDLDGRRGEASTTRYTPVAPTPTGPAGITQAEAQVAFDAWLSRQGLTDTTGPFRIRAKAQWWAENPEYANIPVLGNGGLVTRPTLAVVGEAGPELIVPLSKVQVQAGNRGHDHEAAELRKEIVGLRADLKKALAQKNQKPIQVVLELDGKVLGSAMVDQKRLFRKARRVGL